MPPDEIGASRRPGLSAFLASVMTFGTKGGTNSITIPALQERMRDFEVQCVLYYVEERIG